MRPLLLHAGVVVVAILAVLLLPGLPGQGARLQAGWIDISKVPLPSDPDSSPTTNDFLASWVEEPRETTAEARSSARSSSEETDAEPAPPLHLADAMPALPAASTQQARTTGSPTGPTSSADSDARLSPAPAHEPLLITFLPVAPRDQAPEPAHSSIFHPPRPAQG